MATTEVPDGALADTFLQDMLRNRPKIRPREAEEDLLRTQMLAAQAFGGRLFWDSVKQRPLPTSTPQLPFKRPQIPSNRYHKALNRGTLGSRKEAFISTHRALCKVGRMKRARIGAPVSPTAPRPFTGGDRLESLPY